MWNNNKKNGGKNEKPSIVTRETIGFTLGVFCVLVLLVSFTGGLIFGDLGTAIASFFFGLFGFMTYFVFAGLLYLAVVLIVGKNFIPGKLMTASGFCLVGLIGLLVHAAATAGYPQANYGEFLAACFEAGNNGAFGSPFGAFGGLITYPFTAIASHAGAYILFAAGIGLCLYLFVSSVCKYKGIRLPLRRKPGAENDKTAGQKAAARRPVSFSELENDRVPQTADMPSASGQNTPVYNAPGQDMPSYGTPSYTAPSYSAPPAEPVPQEYPYGQQEIYERDRRQSYEQNTARNVLFGANDAGKTFYGQDMNYGQEPPQYTFGGTPMQTSEGGAGGTENMSVYDRGKDILYGSGANPAEYRNRNLIFDTSSHYNNRPQKPPAAAPSEGASGGSGKDGGEKNDSSYTSMYSREIDGNNAPSPKPREVVREESAQGGYSIYRKDVFDAYAPEGQGPARQPSEGYDGAEEESGYSEGYAERKDYGAADVSEPIRPSYRAPADTSYSEKAEKSEAAGYAPAAAEPPSAPHGAEEEKGGQREEPPRVPEPKEEEPAANMSLRERFTVDRRQQEAERDAARRAADMPAARQTTEEREEETFSANKDKLFDDDFDGSAPFLREDADDDVPDFRVDGKREIPLDRSREGLSAAMRDRTERADRIPPDRNDRGGERMPPSRESAAVPVRETPPPPPPPKPKPRVPREYVRPTLDIFDSHADSVSVDPSEIERNKQGIVDTLEGFGIAVEIANVKVGPSFTRYDINFPKNVTVKAIARCADNIAMALRTEAINIMSNFSQGTIAIEVPNRNPSTVGMRTMLQAEDYINAKPGSLTFCLGKNIEGKPVCSSLVKMTHLLVAGTSGSGKSGFLHQLIVSLIMKYSPEEMRLILIDPKGTEFAAYRGLPNLMINEIVSDVSRAIVVLNWLINEMEHRYTLFTQMTETGKVVRNIDEYNSTVAERVDRLPKIVIVADELADFMLQAKKDIEDRISRLAAKSRAAGIHLVLATQRPSVDIITGVLKSNLSSRVALRVSSEVDSRVILDESGAENLLGLGDLLYKTGSMFSPERVQGAWITEKELQKLCNFICEHNEAYYDESVTQFIDSGGKNAGGGAGEEEDDGEVESVYIDALRFVVQSGSASISMIQRKCSVGYNKAGKIIEWMEMSGYISPFEGAKSRKVLLTADEFREKYGEL